jgi:Sigma-70, region 4
MAVPDPGTEPMQFVGYAARRQRHGLATLVEPCDYRVPEARHVEMLRLRLVEGLTLREVGERTGVGPERVRQLLSHYFGLRGVPPAAKARLRRKRMIRVTASSYCRSWW